MYMTKKRKRPNAWRKTYAQSVGPVGQAALVVCCTMCAAARSDFKQEGPRQFGNDAPRRSCASTLAQIRKRVKTST